MNREDIEKRLKLCERKRMEFLEADKPRTAEKYENEIWKWEELLKDLNSSEIIRRRKLEDYERAYRSLKNDIKTIKEILWQYEILDNLPLADDVSEKLLKLLGDDEVSEWY